MLDPEEDPGVNVRERCVRFYAVNGGVRTVAVKDVADIQ